MTEDPRPTIAERYAAAARSSDLRLRDERAGAIDLVMAAGIAATREDRRAGLAVMLFRLLTEYDVIRAQYEAADARLELAQAMADAEERSVRVGPTRAQPMREAAEERALIDRAMVLLHLKSLPAVKEAFGDYAVVLATRRGFMRPDGDVYKLAGRTLSVFLEPRCRSCHGLGFTGAALRGEVEMVCRDCKGTTNRSANLGRDEDEREFSRYLLSQMDGMLVSMENTMKRLMRRE